MASIGWHYGPTFAIEQTTAETRMDDDRKLLAQYANWFNIGHNGFEFVVDFGQYHADAAEGMVHTRIVLGPAYAKVLCRLLNESLERYEVTFGEIPDATV